MIKINCEYCGELILNPKMQFLLPFVHCNKKECIKKYNRDIRKEWAIKNKVHIAKYHKNYYKKNIKKLRIYQRNWKRKKANGNRN